MVRLRLATLQYRGPYTNEARPGALPVLRAKMILPALTEACFRRIKYSLFPPLGLATLASYLDPDDEVVLQDEHVETLLGTPQAFGRRLRGLSYSPRNARTGSARVARHAGPATDRAARSTSAAPARR